MKKLAVLVAATGFALPMLWVHGSHAATTSANLQVVAGVGVRCTVAVSSLSFGNYDPQGTHATNPMDGSGSVVMNCASGTAPYVTLGQGLYPDPASDDAVPLRNMSNGASLLSYNLFVDAARTQVWNNEPPGERPASPLFPAVMPIYARVPPASSQPQVPTPGAYSDSVVITIIF